MGQKESADKGLLTGSITPEEMQRYCKETLFTPNEIMRLLLLYRQIAGIQSDGGDGLIDESEFISSLSITNPKIGHLMYVMLDKDGDHHVDFEEFIVGLNTFMPNAPLDAKIELCFNAYDEDGNKTISKDEIKSIIMISLEGNAFMSMDEAHLDQLVDDLFDKFDSRKEGEMMKDEFFNLVRQAPGILEPFQFDLSVLPELHEMN